MEKATFDIAGMRCGACSVGIELTLAKKNGIKIAKISYNEKMAIVEYDPAIITTSGIIKIVDDLGYIATLKK